MPTLRVGMGLRPLRGLTLDGLDCFGTLQAAEPFHGMAAERPEDVPTQSIGTGGSWVQRADAPRRHKRVMDPTLVPTLRVGTALRPLRGLALDGLDCFGTLQAAEPFRGMAAERPEDVPTQSVGTSG